MDMGPLYPEMDLKNAFLMTFSDTVYLLTYAMGLGSATGFVIGALLFSWKS